MCTLRLLIVEDNDEDISTFQNCVDRYMDENHCEIAIQVCKNIYEAIMVIDNSFDGAIIDLKLAGHGDEGNQVIRHIENLQFRIPVITLTGTPDAVDSSLTNIKVFKKGEPDARYDSLLKIFWDIYNTGLTRIMGGRGTIEKILGKVFRERLLQQIDKWKDYGKVDSARTEKALLRHAINHLLQCLDVDEDLFFPEEVYIYPAKSQRIHTGSVIKNKETNQMFVVMTPECDLVIRDNGKSKTDSILAIKIDNQDDIFPGCFDTVISKTKRKKFEDACKNKLPYLHNLPRTDFFNGGFLNFRKLSSQSVDKYDEIFESVAIQISPAFVKDIVARFSAYYARQGQPDIDFNYLNTEAV